MRQRIVIACNPKILICDEPTTALHVTIQEQVLNPMSQLQKKRSLTYLFISHDLSVMRFICDRVAVMHKGHIVEMADAEPSSAARCTPTPRRCSRPFLSPTLMWIRTSG